MNSDLKNRDLSEQLSAFADGELGADETRFLIRRLEADADLRATLGRYELIRNAMRRELPAVAPSRFVSDVLDRIEAPAAPAVASRSPWLRYAGGGAIAAAVAMVALMAVSPTTQDPVAGAPAIAAQPVEAPAPTLAQPTPIRTDDLLLPYAAPVENASAGYNPPLMSAQAPTVYDPQVEGYLIRHGNALSNQQGGVFVPYVYVVSSPRRGVQQQAVAQPQGR